MATREIAAAFANWLATKYDFRLFITLSTNSPGLSPQRARSLLSHWDARMNRLLHGPKWQKKYDELLLWFGVFERPNSNPHWHLLLARFGVDDATWEKQVAEIDAATPLTWRKLIASGTTDVQMVTSQEALIDYIAKEIDSPLQYENWVAPDGFRNR